MNEEQIAKAREAKSADDLLGLAKENGMELTKEEAEDLYKRLHSSTELTDEELENVAGGGCGSSTVKVDGVLYRSIGDATVAVCMTGKYTYQKIEDHFVAYRYKGEVCGNCAHFVHKNHNLNNDSGYCDIPY